MVVEQLQRNQVDSSRKMLINCEILIVLGRVLFFAEQPLQHVFQQQLKMVDDFQFIYQLINYLARFFHSK